MGRDLGVYLARTLARDAAVRAVAARGAAVTAHETADFMLRDVVVLSSPLQRCVQTAHNIVQGYRRRCGDIAARTQPDDADADRRATAAALPVPQIGIEEALVEEDRWLYNDLRDHFDLRSHADRAPQPVWHDAAFHKQRTSALVVPDLVPAGPSALATTKHVYERGGVREVHFTSKQPVPLQARCDAAAKALIGGAHDPLTDGKTVVLVSHGATCNAWRAAIAEISGEQGSSGAAWVPYTGFVTLARSPGSSKYFLCSGFFETPHLTAAA